MVIVVIRYSRDGLRHPGYVAEVQPNTIARPDLDTVFVFKTQKDAIAFAYWTNQHVANLLDSAYPLHLPAPEYLRESMRMRDSASRRTVCCLWV